MIPYFTLLQQLIIIARTVNNAFSEKVIRATLQTNAEKTDPGQQDAKRDWKLKLKAFMTVLLLLNGDICVTVNFIKPRRHRIQLLE